MVDDALGRCMPTRIGERHSPLSDVVLSSSSSSSLLLLVAGVGGGRWLVCCWQAQVDARCRQVLEGKRLQPLSAAESGSGLAKRGRVLIIDEVDVLYSEDMVGRVWNYDGQHHHESVSMLYDDIWSGRYVPVSFATKQWLLSRSKWGAAAVCASPFSS
jgi:hypothetical protein